MSACCIVLDFSDVRKKKIQRHTWTGFKTLVQECPVTLFHALIRFIRLYQVFERYQPCTFM